MFGIGFLQKKRKGWPADASSYDENVERHCKSGCRREVAHKHCVYEACSFVGYWYRDLDKISSVQREDVYIFEKFGLILIYGVLLKAAFLNASPTTYPRLVSGIARPTTSPRPMRNVIAALSICVTAHSQLCVSVHCCLDSPCCLPDHRTMMRAYFAFLNCLVDE